MTCDVKNLKRTVFRSRAARWLRPEDFSSIIGIRPFAVGVHRCWVLLANRIHDGSNIQGSEAPEAADKDEKLR